MDSTASGFKLDKNGNCNYCNSYFEEKERILIGDKENYKESLDKLINKIKKNGERKKYDCIIGVSGGVDSTYIAYYTKHLGLRPLAVHLDNGWDSELAVSNIEKTLRTLNIDLYTYVINWNEFKDLQLSFLKASIPGMEIPSDHAIFAVLNKIALKYKVKYIINGSNFRMEKIMAPNWSEMVGQMDWKLIKNIHKEFGHVKLKTYPHFTRFQWYFSRLIQRKQVINLLNHIPFSKEKAMKEIQEKLGWVYYGGKHYESIYTRFTQAYIQPLKFDIDKRKAHLSNLICMGELTRQEALYLLEKDAYSDVKMMNNDIEYFKKKLNLSNSDFDEIMNANIKSYKDYHGYFNNRIYIWVDSIALTFHNFLKKSSYY